MAAIEAIGGTAVPIRANLLDRQNIPRIVDEVRAALGPITVLVNNAAFTAPGRPPRADAPVRPKAPKSGGGAKPDWPGFVTIPVSAYRRHFEIAVFAGYELMQLVAPDMIAAGRGSIINISSVASRLPGSGPFGDTSGGCCRGTADRRQRWSI